ncbi:hypothetical protein SeGA_4051 [Salmonella enterica subsp. enterica serovar Gaminara str. A4-567]|nr:hypothetical protein SeGA_4051 [Salmonella enterica subsp. enterica serovar Gaminara str. A4-567]
MPGCRQQPGASPIPFIAVWRLTYAFIFYDDQMIIRGIARIIMMIIRGIARIIL